jgi:hypothetical protein
MTIIKTVLRAALDKAIQWHIEFDLFHATFVEKFAGQAAPPRAQFRKLLDAVVEDQICQMLERIGRYIPSS